MSEQESVEKQGGVFDLLLRMYRTTVGKKVVMALSGAVLVLFVLGHMAGNLKMFAGMDPSTGQYKLDHYAELLREIGADFLGPETFLWIVRLVLLLCVVLHAISGISLARRNRAAKPINYVSAHHSASNAASRTMMYGGLCLLAFIVFHILHFTTGTVHTAGFVYGAVYANVYSAFQSSLIASIYVVAMGLLALHLYHGVWSMFQTLGVDSPRWNSTIRGVTKLVAVVIFIGFSSVPVAATLQLVPAPTVAALGKPLTASHGAVSYTPGVEADRPEAGLDKINFKIPFASSREEFPEELELKLDGVCSDLKERV